MGRGLRAGSANIFAAFAKIACCPEVSLGSDSEELALSIMSPLYPEQPA
jgi:hypothetical protein